MRFFYLCIFYLIIFVKIFGNGIRFLPYLLIFPEKNLVSWPVSMTSNHSG